MKKPKFTLETAVEILTAQDALRTVLEFLESKRIAHQKARSYSLPKNGKAHAFVVIDGLRISNLAWEQLSVIARQQGFEVICHSQTIIPIDSER